MYRMMVVFSVLFVFSCGFSPAQEPDFQLPVDPVVTLNMYKTSAAKWKLDLLDAAERQVVNVKDLAPLFKQGSPEQKKEASELLTELQSTAGFLLNGSYEKEMLPLLIGKVKGNAPPAKPTALQSRLLSASKGDLNQLVFEIIKEINSQRRAVVEELQKSTKALENRVHRG